MGLSIIKYLLVTVEIVACVLLIGVILIQRSKSQGMGMAFGAGMGEALFGAQVGNVLTRTTVILAIIFLVNTTLLAILGSARRSSSVADAYDGVPAGPAPGAVPAGSGAPPAEGLGTDVPMPPVDATPMEEIPTAEPTADVPVAVPAAEPDAPAMDEQPAKPAPSPAAGTEPVTQPH